MILAAHLERLVVGDGVAGLGKLALPRENLAGHDERLGLGAALRQAALDESDVGAALADLRLTHGAPSPGRGRRSAAIGRAGGTASSPRRRRRRGPAPARSTPRARRDRAETRRPARRRSRPPSSRPAPARSEEHTSELQSLMRSSYAVFRLKKKN